MNELMTDVQVMCLLCYVRHFAVHFILYVVMLAVNK